MVIFGAQAPPGGRVLRLRLEWFGPAELTKGGLEAVPQDLRGIYVIQDHWVERGVFPVAYAGKAVDLRTRLQAHARGTGNPWVAGASGSRELFFSCAPVRDANLRAAAEATLIWVFQPRFNAQVPALSPIPITLPPHQEESADGE